jgi:hypothetical protein
LVAIPFLASVRQEAGRYALEAFGPTFRPVIEEALAFWHGEPPTARYRLRPELRRRAAAAFVEHVIDSANRDLATFDW